MQPHKILINDQEEDYEAPSISGPSDTISTSSDHKPPSSPESATFFNSKSLNNATIWLKTGAKSLAKKCRIVDDTDDGKTNLIQSIFNLINANLGTGILAMPFVIRLGGYWGILITIVVGILGNYTGKMLINLLYEETADGQRVRVRDSYADIGEEFSPRFGRLMVHIINCIEQFSHCVLLLIMPGTVIAHTFPKSGMSESTWIFLLSLIIIPTILVRKMHQVTWTCIVSVCIATVISLFVLGYSLMNHPSWDSEIMPSFNPNITPISFGIVMVTYSSQAYLPSIERCMREPESFDLLMDFSYTVVTIFKCVIGIIVFLAFTFHTEQIMTLNLPYNLFGYLINISAIILSLSFYTVPMFAVFDILENQILLPRGFDKVLDTETKYVKYLTPNLLFRLCIVMLFITIAAAVPHFSLLMSFVGNTTGTILVLLYPCLFSIKIRWNVMSNTEVVTNSLIICFALFSGVFGVTSDARAFYSVFNKAD
ncbi:vesicular inhibitory amino acid transporter-like [Clytia hemisphaerica]|uniref:vesicular inhibitory amino acid transporter-like n=1 Tax=Clytia hemisphaerica TaxID=252671 RepID=UPI0034D41F56|eukprot:TCONS_00049518-protein